VVEAAIGQRATERVLVDVHSSRARRSESQSSEACLIGLMVS
jgi:hypothetical protein